jgi:hypothetical protein
VANRRKTSLKEAEVAFGIRPWPKVFIDRPKDDDGELDRGKAFRRSASQSFMEAHRRPGRTGLLPVPQTPS